VLKRCVKKDLKKKRKKKQQTYLTFPASPTHPFSAAHLLFSFSAAGPPFSPAAHLSRPTFPSLSCSLTGGSHLQGISYLPPPPPAPHRPTAPPPPRLPAPLPLPPPSCAAMRNAPAPPPLPLPFPKPTLHRLHHHQWRLHRNAAAHRHNRAPSPPHYPIKGSPQAPLQPAPLLLASPLVQRRHRRSTARPPEPPPRSPLPALLPPFRDPR
jgi:hypothetical protein